TIRLRLADCYFIGYALEFSLGDFEDAHRWLLRVLDLREAMAGANPSVHVYRRSLAADLLHLGSVLTRLRREPEAQDALRRSTDLTEALLVEEPGSGSARML